MFGSQRVTKKPFFMLLCIVLSSCSKAERELPSRSECIVRVHIVDDQLGKHEIEDSYLQISRAIRGSKDRSFPSTPPSLVIPKSDRRSIYLQYRENCSDRIELTEYLLSEYVQPYVSIMPDYKLSAETVDPSPRTIDIQGAFWAD